jgi:hypothetical protein
MERGFLKLLLIESNDKPILLAQEYIKGFLRRYNTGTYEEAKKHQC